MPWTLKSLVPMPMGLRETPSFEKSLASACLHLWRLHAGVWEMESTFPILMLWATKHSFPSNNGIQSPRWCVSSDLHLCQCQWRCLNSALSSPLGSQEQAVKHEQPNYSSISFCWETKAEVATPHGKSWACAFSFPNTDWLMEKKNGV